jgi:hypothetical protein
MGIGSKCPGTYGGREHDGHGRVATRFLVEQELGIAFRHIVANPPPNAATVNDQLVCFLEYGAILVRSVVPETFSIHPLWTCRPGSATFREFQLKRSKNVAQFNGVHPGQISKAFLAVPPWTAENSDEYAEILAVPHLVWAATYLAQCSSGFNTAGLAAGFVGTGHPHHDGRVFRRVGDEIIGRDWMLLEPRENGEMRDDGEVPYGFAPSFPLFGERIAVNNIANAESDVPSTSSSSGKFFEFFDMSFRLYC